MQLIISLLLFYPQNSHQTGTATASRSAYLTSEHPKCCERFHLVVAMRIVDASCQPVPHPMVRQPEFVGAIYLAIHSIVSVSATIAVMHP